MRDQDAHKGIQILAISTLGAAESLGIQPSTLEKDRVTGRLGVPYSRAGRRVIYQLSDLKAWLEEQKQTPIKKGAKNA